MNKSRYILVLSSIFALTVAGAVVVEAQRRNARQGGRNSGQRSLSEPFRARESVLNR